MNNFLAVIGIAATALVVVFLNRPAIHCSQPVWTVREGYCDVQFTVGNRREKFAAAAVTINAYRARSLGKGGRADYLGASRRIDLKLAPKETKLIRERFEVGRPALRTVEVVVREQE